MLIFPPTPPRPAVRELSASPVYLLQSRRRRWQLVWRVGNLAFFCCLLVACGFGCQAPRAGLPQPEVTTYRGREAIRLTDGRLEAIVVPAMGRIMRFAPIGGRNLLWELDPRDERAGQFNNFGGDKLFIGPHDVWLRHAPGLWPPPAGWDAPARWELVGNAVRTESPVWHGFGIRLVREISFRPGGVLRMAQRLEKVNGDMESIRGWTVTQVMLPDRVMLPRDEVEASPQGFEQMSAKGDSVDLRPAGELLQLKPINAFYKIGVDAADGRLWAEFGSMRFEQRLVGRAGPKAGRNLPRVEIYENAAPAARYIELELLTPAAELRVGQAIEMTVEWRLASIDEPKTAPSAGRQTAAGARAGIGKLDHE